jgi:uncharacterized membrane protein YhaH (DUF805 family)
MYDTTYAADNGASSAFSGVFVLIWLALVVFSIVATWKLYTKAGKPGWASIVPFYNVYVLLQIAGRPGWWMLLFFVPFVNIVIGLLLALDLAKVFGKSTVFGVVGLFLFSTIGYAMLAFGSAKYTAPAPQK